MSSWGGEKPLKEANMEDNMTTKEMVKQALAAALLAQKMMLEAHKQAVKVQAKESNNG